MDNITHELYTRGSKIYKTSELHLIKEDFIQIENMELVKTKGIKVTGIMHLSGCLINENDRKVFYDVKHNIFLDDEVVKESFVYEVINDLAR